MNIGGGASNFVDTLWRFFASVRLTVVILLTLAVSSVIGTLIPQNASKADYIGKYGIAAYRIFSTLDLMDMYHSWWFRLFMCMLAFNVLVCSLDRMSATFKMVFVKNPSFNIQRFRSLSNSLEIISSRPLADLLDQYPKRIAKWFSYTRVENTDLGNCIFAEKGRWSRLGFYFVHISVVLLLIGGLIGSIFGFDGFVNIPEGESINRIRLNNSSEMVSLDFQIRCDDFSVSFYDTGQPKEFRSKLTLIEGDHPVLTQDIVVNSPLRYKGLNIFQSSYGPISPEKVALVFEDSKTGTSFPLTVSMGQSVQLPDNLGSFHLKAFVNAKAFRGMDLGQTLVGELVLTDTSPEEVLLPTRFPNFDKMRQGSFVITLSKLENRYYTGLQVTRDPGVWFVYLGFFMLIGGCMVTFFMSHQRVCIEMIPLGKGTRVVFSGFSNKNNLGMRDTLKRVAERLKVIDE